MTFSRPGQGGRRLPSGRRLPKPQDGQPWEQGIRGWRLLPRRVIRLIHGVIQSGEDLQYRWLQTGSTSTYKTGPSCHPSSGAPGRERTAADILTTSILAFPSGSHQIIRIQDARQRSLTMLSTTFVLLSAALGVSGHYTFPKAGGGADWQQVRKADNWQNNGFVGDVTSAQIRCFQSSPAAASATLNVTAGSTVTYSSAPSVYHPGPMQFYLARVPDGQTVTSWNGDGAVWFKVYQEQPNFGAQLTLPSNGMAPLTRI